MHKKFNENNESGGFNEHGTTFLSVQQKRLENLAKIQAEMMRQINNMNREFTESYNQNADCVREMMSQISANPAEAGKICHQWLTSQIERLFDQNRKLSREWFTLMQDTTATTLQKPEHEQGQKSATGHKIEAVRPTTHHQATG